MYTILTRSQCNFCDSAKALLNAQGEAYDVYNVQHADNRWMLKLMVMADLRTVPQVFAPSGEYIGGYTELKDYMLNKGKRDV